MTDPRLIKFGERVVGAVLSIALLFVGGLAHAKSRASEEAAAMVTHELKKRADHILLFNTREEDLLKPKFRVGSPEALDQMMSNKQNFWSRADALKPGRILSKNKENVVFQVLDLSIDSVKAKKTDRDFEVTNQLRVTTSEPMNQDAVTKYLRETLVERQHVVRVVLVVVPQGNPAPAGKVSK